MKANAALADRDGDGTVSLAEYTRFLQTLGLDPGQAAARFQVLDRNGDGQLSLEEWIAAGLAFYSDPSPQPGT